MQTDYESPRIKEARLTADHVLSVAACDLDSDCNLAPQTVLVAPSTCDDASGTLIRARVLAAPTNDSAGCRDRGLSSHRDYLKDSLRLSVFFGLEFALTIFICYLFCPFLLPAAYWSHDSASPLRNAAVVGLFSGLFSAAAMLGPGLWSAFRGRKTVASNVVELALSRESAFELCLSALEHSKIEYVNERKGEIELRFSKRVTFHFRIEEQNDKSSRIIVTRRFAPFLSTFFSQKSVDTQLFPSINEGKSAVTEIVERIRAQAQMGTPWEQEYPSFSIDYRQPTCSIRSGLRALSGFVVLSMCLCALAHLFFFDLWVKYESRNNPTLALGLYDVELWFAPDRAESYAGRGALHLSLEHPELAERDFRQCIRLGLPSYIGLQASLIEQGRLADAQILDATIRKHFQESAATLSHRGWVDAICGNAHASILESNKSIRLNPSDAFGYEVRGYAHHRLGDEQHAVADYSTALTLNPNDTVALMLRSRALRRLGEVAQADRDEGAARAKGFVKADLCVPPAFDEFGDPT